MIKNEYDERMRELFFTASDASDNMRKVIAEVASAKKMFELLPSPQVKEYLDVVREKLCQSLAEYEDAARDANSYLEETKSQRYTTLDYHPLDNTMDVFALNVSRLK